MVEGAKPRPKPILHAENVASFRFDTKSLPQSFNSTPYISNLFLVLLRVRNQTLFPLPRM
jgi:hypothetical protein